MTEIDSNADPTTNAAAHARGESSLVVAQVIGTFQGGTGGGPARLAHNLAHALGQRNVQSLCISIRSTGVLATEGGRDVEVVDLGAGDDAVRIPAAMARLRRVIRERSIDVLHIHGQSALPFCALATFGMRRLPRLMFVWHNSEWVLADRGIKGAVMNWSLRRCERVDGSSEAVAERLGAARGLHCKPGVFINGVPESSASHGVAAHEPKIVWVARFMPTKDPQLLIRAAARLRDEGLRFTIVMAGGVMQQTHQWFWDQSQELIRSLNLQNVVRTPGWVANVEDLLQDAAIAVQTSHTEGLSMGLLEQMMAGLAVIATDVGDTRRAVRDGDTGILFNVRDEDALVHGLRRLITDVALRTRLGAAARAVAVREFSLTAMADRALAMYAQ